MIFLAFREVKLQVNIYIEAVSKRPHSVKGERADRCYKTVINITRDLAFRSNEHQIFLFFKLFVRIASTDPKS